MTTSNPKIIFNCTMTDEDFEKKVALAMEEYTEKVILSNLDKTISKIVDKRINTLISGSRYDPRRMIQGRFFDDFVKEKTESAIVEVIDKNIKEIFAKKVAEML